MHFYKSNVQLKQCADSISINNMFLFWIFTLSKDHALNFQISVDVISTTLAQNVQTVEFRRYVFKLMSLKRPSTTKFDEQRFKTKVFSNI